MEISASNYRCFHKLRWAPEGVSVLVGPNGSGKSTLLSVITFLSTYIGHGLEQAVEASGPAWGLARWDAPPDAAVSFRVCVDDLVWEVDLKARPGGAEPRPGERLSRDGELILLQEAGSPTFQFRDQEIPIGSGAAITKLVAVVAEARGEISPVLDRLEGCRVYAEPDLTAIRRRGSPESNAAVLLPRGENVFAVLRNWRSGLREQQQAFEFVESGLKAAFADLFDGFVLQGVARTVVGQYYDPRRSAEPIGFEAAPNGLLVALLHLVAVASTSRGGVVAIDEFENGLHPAAIRNLVEHIREFADERELTVLLSTHSPAVLDEFHEEREQVFVLESTRSEGAWPMRLTEHVDREWLAHFTLGDRYGRDYAQQGR